PESPATAEHAPELAQGTLQIVDVADAETDGRRVEVRVREGQREQVARNPLELGRLPPGALEHALGEVEAGHASAGTRTGDRQIAGSAAGIEHGIAGPHDRLRGEAAPPPVEPGRH